LQLYARLGKVSQTLSEEFKKLYKYDIEKDPKKSQKKDVYEFLSAKSDF
jgi:hypothetical protein